MIQDFNFGRIVIIGDLVLDCYVHGSVDRISPEAPVPVLLRAQHTAVPGGAANVAMNAAALGCDVVLIGLIGPDVSGTMLKNALQLHPNIDISGLVEDHEWTTITKTRVLSGRQQIVRIDEEHIKNPSENTRKRLMENIVKATAQADVVVCSDYAKGVLGDDVIRVAIEAANKQDIPIIVDPKRRDFSVYRGASLVTPNRSELAAATNLPTQSNSEIERAAHCIARQFGGDVLVTRSEEGMTLFRNNGEIIHSQVRKSEVYDVSGAGDTVVATIASMISAGQDLETAVVIATNAASIVVSKLGTATVSRAELSAVLLAGMQESGALTDLDHAKLIIEEWHHHGARVVFTNGCFDLLHPGHISLLRSAAQQGDKLVVAINSDASVARLKGPTRPLQDEQARATVIGALRYVDLVVIFDEDTPLETIKALRPDVIVKGADYQEDEVVGGEFVKSYGGLVVLVDLVSGRSTTSIVRKMTSPSPNSTTVKS
ncbi:MULTISPECIES: D-glycero-beta-D-manno-heptose-7-phosphate kinase [Gluconobacter]|uniref:D-glycero-beta-D-manno-heptose-7-phosphate kinase n=1 Tax=Gluconobacter TaxID=441 RepID=UPI0039EBFC0B